MDSLSIFLIASGVFLFGLGALLLAVTYVGFQLLNKMSDPGIDTLTPGEVHTFDKSEVNFDHTKLKGSLGLESVDFDQEWFNTNGTAKPLNTCDHCGNNNPRRFKIGLNGTTAECLQCENIIEWTSKSKGLD